MEIKEIFGGLKMKRDFLKQGKTHNPKEKEIRYSEHRNTEMTNEVSNYSGWEF